MKPQPGSHRILNGLIRLVPSSTKEKSLGIALMQYLGRRWLRWSLGSAGEDFVEVPHPLAPGCRLRLDLSFERRYWVGNYEPAVVKAFRKAIRPGDVAYDVGAYIGYFSLLLGRLCGPEGAVYAFEPDSRAFVRLSENLAASGVRNVFPFQVALADRVGTGCLMEHVSPDGRLLATGRGGNGSPIATTSLDHLVYAKGMPRPHLIKMDVEGAEGRVLQGAARLLRESRPRLVIEIHGEGNGREVCRRLQALGYRICRVSGGRGELAEGAFVAGGHIGAWPRERAGPGWCWTRK